MVRGGSDYNDNQMEEVNDNHESNGCGMVCVVGLGARHVRQCMVSVALFIM